MRQGSLMECLVARALVNGSTTTGHPVWKPEHSRGRIELVVNGRDQRYLCCSLRRIGE
jgi:hypothetical protein